MDILCTNILEDQTLWRDKMKGLSHLVIDARVVAVRMSEFHRIGAATEKAFGCSFRFQLRNAKSFTTDWL